MWIRRWEWFLPCEDHNICLKIVPNIFDPRYVDKAYFTRPTSVVQDHFEHRCPQHVFLSHGRPLKLSCERLKQQIRSSCNVMRKRTQASSWNMSTFAHGTSTTMAALWNSMTKPPPWNTRRKMVNAESTDNILTEATRKFVRSTKLWMAYLFASWYRFFTKYDSWYVLSQVRMRQFASHSLDSGKQQ